MILSFLKNYINWQEQNSNSLKEVILFRNVFSGTCKRIDVAVKLDLI